MQVKRGKKSSGTTRRNITDHPGTETQPTVDACNLNAFWDEGITDPIFPTSTLTQPVEQLPETAREAGKAELGEPSEPRFRQKKDKGKAPIREEEEAE